jgi:hypothetical protein
MKLFIPALGTELTLQEPWAFTVYQESRNSSLISLLTLKPSKPTAAFKKAKAAEWATQVANYPRWYGRAATADDEQRYFESYWRQTMEGKKLGTHTFPAKTVLIVDRIYIRQGQDDFDSVTFRAKYYHSSEQTGFGKKGKMVRFWAKLDDVNTMQVEDL